MLAACNFRKIRGQNDLDAHEYSSTGVSVTAANITIIGTGYVGLVTGAGFAELGHNVTCVDIDQRKIDLLQKGEIPIFEDGLAELVVRNMRAGRLQFQVGQDDLSLANQYFYLCVPTPQGPDGAADLRYLEEAVLSIGPLVPTDAIIVNKSTVPVGSTVFVEQHINRRDVHVVSNPEFLREGSAVQDFMHPDRIVIGGDDQAACVRVESLYLELGANILITDAASAELIKYASNAFLATKLSFINAIAAVCEGVGADVDKVRLGMGYDSRIGLDFLHPGPGWGGSCFPKDTQAMLRIAEDAGYDFELLRSAITSNNDQFERVVNKLRHAVGGDLQGARIGMLGLSFKAGTDDTRMSPALAVAKRLLNEGATVVAYDPVAVVLAEGIEQVMDPYAVFDNADVGIVMTEWPEFKWLDLHKAAALMRGHAIVDTRGVLELGGVAQAGLSLVAVGR